MPTIKTNDGAEIFYKDWSAKNGSGQPIVFHHGGRSALTTGIRRCSSSSNRAIA